MKGFHADEITITQDNEGLEILKQVDQHDQAKSETRVKIAQIMTDLLKAIVPIITTPNKATQPAAKSNRKNTRKRSK